MRDESDDKRKDNATPTKGRGGGQGKPRTPSGRRERWQPPKNLAATANREKPPNAGKNIQAMRPTVAMSPTWHSPPLSPESAMFGHWELSVIPVQNGSYWEWTATLPDWEDETGKLFKGASFKGRALTKEDAKQEAVYQAKHALVG